MKKGVYIGDQQNEDRSHKRYFQNDIAKIDHLMYLVS